MHAHMTRTVVHVVRESGRTIIGISGPSGPVVAIVLIGSVTVLGLSYLKLKSLQAKQAAKQQETV